jgi:hypothetical protein
MQQRTLLMAHKQIFAAYWRTWRDKAHDPLNHHGADEIPAGVDILNIFPWDTPASSPFWKTLKDHYVPTLKARGTRVVISKGEKSFIADEATYPNDEAGYARHAEMLMATEVDGHGLDGIDIDYEEALNADEQRLFVGRFLALAKHLGPQSGSGRLLILDTNQDGNDPVVSQLTRHIDYLFLQAYGRNAASLQATMNTFKGRMSRKCFVPGFSFHEERGTNWHDVSADRHGGNAFDYARWQPEGSRKGGIFCYALDRDIAETTDQLIAADFAATRRLIDLLD